MFEQKAALCSAALLALLLGVGCAQAQTENFIGKWVLALDSGRNVDYGILQIEQDGADLRVFIDGGPVNLLDYGANSIRFDMDWTDGGDRLHVTELQGMLTQNGLTGVMSEMGEPTGDWSARRWAEHPEAGAAPAPTDIFGIWLNLSRGTHKDTFDLTEVGRSINDAYDPSLDDPHLRCVSGGTIRMEDGPMGYEIIDRGDHILILYEYFHEVRRIWMDDRDFPDHIDEAYLTMGYSIGHWEGSSLVIETRGMKPTVWDANGMPVSTSAVVHERKYLDDAQRLHTEITLQDPENYRRPVYRHLYRERSPDAQLNESTCDPHSFYRSLQLEGRFDEYWERSANRF